MKKNILNKRISVRFLSIAAWCILFALLIPMLIAAYYDVPSMDDYGYGKAVKEAVEVNKNIFQVLGAAASTAVDTWKNWQGSFSAVFMMALMPASINSHLYGITTWIMLLSLCTGTAVFCKVLWKDVFHQGGSGLFCGAVILIGCTQFLPSAVQGFYWYNGSVYYTFFFGASLLLFAVEMKYLITPKSSEIVFLCIGGFIIGGGNYITALLTVIMLCAGTVLSCWKKHSARLLWPLLFTLVSLLLSISAPGNAVRQALYPTEGNAVISILESFQLGGYYLVHWFRFSTLLIILPIAFIAKFTTKNEVFSYPFPWLVTLFSYCIFSAMFCPTQYATGSIGADRLMDIIYYAYLILLSINIYYWIGYANRQKEGHVIHLKSFAALGLLEMVILIGVCKSETVTSVSAVHTILSGEGKEYREEYEQRLSILEDKTIVNAALPSFSVYPYILYYDDISPDCMQWQNLDMSEFYDKNTVFIK